MDQVNDEIRLDIEQNLVGKINNKKTIKKKILVLWTEELENIKDKNLQKKTIVMNLSRRIWYYLITRTGSK